MVLLGVEFLALLFMIVYVGAIAILFLFVVMMLNIKLEELKDNATRYVPIGLIIGLVFIVEVLIILESDISFVAPLDAPFNFLPLSNIQTIGQILYTDY
jgi:NADH-quinone oxidoreductase subunit J